MSKSFLCAMILCGSLLLVSGCFQPPPTVAGDFNSNDLAKEMLGDTTWGDPQGAYSLTFDQNAMLSDISLPDLPAEYANINITGQPFTVTIPEGIELVGGRTLTLSVMPGSTTLDAIGDGYSLDMTFDGDVSGDALAALVDHVELGFSSAISPNGSELSDLQGSITVVGPFGIEVFSTSLNLAQTVPLSPIE